MTWQKMVIGHAIQDPQSMMEADALLPSDFTGEDKAVWAEMTGLFQRDNLSATSLMVALSSRDEFSSQERIEEYIRQAIAMRGTNMKEDVSNVLNEAIKVQIQRSAALIAAEAQNSEKTSDELLTFAEEQIIKLRRNRNEGWTLGSLLGVFMPRLDSIRDGTFLPAWIPALEAVKEVLGYAEATDYIVIAARPGEGKSSWCRFEAYKHLQRGGKGVLMMENENDPIEYARYFLSLDTGLDNGKLKSGNLTAGEMEMVRESARKLHSMPLYIEFATSASDIRRLSRKYKVTKDIDLQMFDYIQLASNGQAKKNDDVSITSRALRLSALEIGVPMIGASQLNREIEHRQDAEPQLSDLRDSGSVEQDACAVIFPRLTWTNPTPEQMAVFPENIDPRSRTRVPTLLPRPKAVPVRFYVKKNRNGEIGPSDVVKWVKSTGYYYTMASGSGV